MIVHLALLAALAAPPCAEFDALLAKTYGFRPSQLDAAGVDAKSAQMDAVWQVVEKDRQLASCLKAALRRTTGDTWFLFDGAQLLVSVEPSKESKQFLLEALTRVPLDDVDLQRWVGLGSQLGLEGFDTSALGKRWLAYPKAEYFLPEHGAYRVDRENGALFLFGALDERFATPALIELTRGERKEIATWLLMSQATPEALAALADETPRGLSAKAAASRTALLQQPALIEPRQTPRTSRAEFVAAFNALLAGDEAPFASLVTGVPDGERDVVAVFGKDDLDLIRKVRRHYAARGTPHAIEFYNQFTQILMTKVWAPPAAAR